MENEKTFFELNAEQRRKAILQMTRHENASEILGERTVEDYEHLITDGYNPSRDFFFQAHDEDSVIVHFKDFG